MGRVDLRRLSAKLSCAAEGCDWTDCAMAAAAAAAVMTCALRACTVISTLLLKSLCALTNFWWRSERKTEASASCTCASLISLMAF